MRARKVEVEAMTALLEAEHEDVELLAKQALALAWSLADQRTRIGLVIDQPGVGVTLHGPFDSDSQVKRYVRDFPFAGPAVPRVLISTLLGPDCNSAMEGDVE